MLATTSSPVIRSIGLFCFLLLTVIYLLRLRNEDDQAILDYTAVSDLPVTTTVVLNADAHEKSTLEVLSAERHSIGDRGSATWHSHEHGRSSHHLEGHEDDELDLQTQPGKSGEGEQGEKALKYHTKAFGSPWGSGGQLGLKNSEVAPGHKKSYGMPVETPSPADMKPGQKKAYYA